LVKTSHFRKSDILEKENLDLYTYIGILLKEKETLEAKNKEILQKLENIREINRKKYTDNVKYTKQLEKLLKEQECEMIFKKNLLKKVIKFKKNN